MEIPEQRSVDFARLSRRWDGDIKNCFEKALAVKDRIRAEVEETEGCLLQGISLEEQKEFMRIAGKMLQNLERDSRADQRKEYRTMNTKDHELMAR